MKTVLAFKADEVKNDHQVSARILHANPHVQTSMITLSAGEALKTHSTPVDVFFYILEGQGIVEIGEEQETVGVDTLIDSPANIPHRLINTGEGKFRFLVVKTPNPNKKPSSS